MSNELTQQKPVTDSAIRAETLEMIILGNDLSALSGSQRMEYYNALCSHLGLNPVTRPFDYIFLPTKANQPDKLSLYANKICAEQLRLRNSISVEIVTRTFDDKLGTFTVEAKATDANGRFDTSIGVVSVVDRQGNLYGGDWMANAQMKAETKSKRRVTLSICGLGIIDETETDSIQGARRARVSADHSTIEAEVVQGKETPPQAVPDPPLTIKDGQVIDPLVGPVWLEHYDHVKDLSKKGRFTAANDIGASIKELSRGSRKALLVELQRILGCHEMGKLSPVHLAWVRQRCADLKWEEQHPKGQPLFGDKAANPTAELSADPVIDTTAGKVDDDLPPRPDEVDVFADE